MKQKRLLTVGVTLFAAASMLAACGGNTADQSSSSDSGSGSSTVELTLWGTYGAGSNSAQKDALEKEIIPAFEKANPGITIKYVDMQMCIRDSFTAERSDKVQWVEFLTKDDGSLDAPSISTVKVADWVNALAAKTDVKPENRVDNVDSQGNVLTVAREGKKGLKTNNTEQITKDVVAAMTDGKAYEGLFHYDDVEPGSETKQVAEGTENLVYQAAEGEKWVDINLTDASVTAYIGGKVAGGPFYMVPGAPDTPTVTGTFHVYLKYDVQTMRGENADGTKYETEGVPWVTYFTGSYAMHGAPWRSSFGWSGYGGSHGCVNMPVDAAKFIYDWTDMGDTVVVHY